MLFRSTTFSCKTDEMLQEVNSYLYQLAKGKNFFCHTLFCSSKNPSTALNEELLYIPQEPEALCQKTVGRGWGEGAWGKLLASALQEPCTRDARSLRRRCSSCRRLPSEHTGTRKRDPFPLAVFLQCPFEKKLLLRGTGKKILKEPRSIVTEQSKRLNLVLSSTKSVTNHGLLI